VSLEAAAEGYEYFDVAADVGVHAWGETVAGCLRQCALGVFDLIVPTGAVEPVETREVAARGPAIEVLLVNWLNECLYVHDLEGFVVHDVEMPQVTGTGIHSVLHGEPVDPARHPRGTVVKAATFHGLEVVERPGRVAARVILDI
jgi:SHS2 domain-containing protein